MVPEKETEVGLDDNVEDYKHRIDNLSSHVNELEQKVKDIESFYLQHCKKPHTNSKYSLHSAPERMQELMNQFGTILNQVIRKKGSRSSNDIIGVKDLGLHDSIEVAGKPRDFSMIKKRMEAKDGSGYENVREIYADVRSILKNAMNCNDKRSDAHLTAETLLNKFEEKWLPLLPKVMQEEERRQGLMQEEERVQQDHHAQMAKETSNKLLKVEIHLKELRDLVIQRCSKMSTLEKRELGKALAQLSAEDLSKALEIVAQSNPAFQVTAEEVDLDIDALDESTLRQLKYFVLDIWQAQGNPSTSTGDNNNDDNTTPNISKPKNTNTKRKRQISAALRETSKKKTKK